MAKLIAAFLAADNGATRAKIAAEIVAHANKHPMSVASLTEAQYAAYAAAVFQWAFPSSIASNAIY